MTIEWKPTKYECPKCHELIWSSYPGEYKSCGCGESFVDETEHYTRTNIKVSEG